MSLRTKTLLIIGLVLVGLVAILYVLSQTILLGNYARLEANNAHQNVERALNVLSDQLTSLSASNGDYAWWDDTYEFAVDHNTSYVDTNIVQSTLTNLQFNLLVMVDTNKQIIASKAVDLSTGRDMPIPTGLHDYLGADSPLLNRSNLRSSVSGLIILPDGPMLVSSQSILTSQVLGPSHGSLIFGEFLDDSRVEKLSTSLGLPVSAYVLSAQDLPSDVETARQNLTPESTIFTSPISSDKIAGYGLVNDIYDKPALLLRVEMPRDIYLQGQSSISIFLLLLVVVGLVFAIITMLLLEQTVISRLRRLSGNLETISQGGDLSNRLTVSGSDELARLGKDVNQMLSALEKTQLALHGNDIQLRTVVKVAPILLWSTDKQGIVTLLEGKELDLLGIPLDSIGRHMTDVFKDIIHLVPEIRRALNGEEFSSILPVGDHVFDSHYVPLRKKDGKIQGMIGVATDITEHEKSEAALQQASQNLTQKNQQLEYTRNLFRSAVRHLGDTIQSNKPQAEMLEYLEFLQKQLNQQN